MKTPTQTIECYLPRLAPGPVVRIEPRRKINVELALLAVGLAFPAGLLAGALLRWIGA